MEEKREIARSYVAEGLKLEIVLPVLSLPRSTYYYRPNGRKQGKKASTHTVHKGCSIGNDKVVEAIKHLLSKEFIDYGYKRMTHALKNKDYMIGKKKVYRLMKENKLLKVAIKRAAASKQHIVYKSPQPDRPMQIVQLDFKYIWIEGAGRFAYLISMLDTFHRQVYAWSLNYDMKTDRVIGITRNFVQRFLVANHIDPKMISLHFQTDNGSQFKANKYTKTLDDIGIQCTYIPKATPQLNGHIEGFHSTLEKVVCSKYKFVGIDHAKTVLNRFFDTYNNDRIMQSILYKSPIKFLKLWNENKIELKKVNKKNKFNLKEKSLN